MMTSRLPRRVRNPAPPRAVHPKRPTANAATARMTSDVGQDHPVGVPRPAAVVVLARGAGTVGPEAAVSVPSVVGRIPWRDDAWSARGVMRSGINGMRQELRSGKSAIRSVISPPAGVEMIPRKERGPLAGVEMIPGKGRGLQIASEIVPPPAQDRNHPKLLAIQNPLMLIMKP